MSGFLNGGANGVRSSTAQIARLRADQQEARPSSWPAAAAWQRASAMGLMSQPGNPRAMARAPERQSAESISFGKRSTKKKAENRAEQRAG